MAIFLVLAALSLYPLCTTGGFICIEREDLTVMVQAYQTEVPVQLDDEILIIHWIYTQPKWNMEYLRTLGTYKHVECQSEYCNVV